MSNPDLRLSLLLQTAVSGLEQVRGLVSEIEDLGGTAGETGAEAARLGEALDALAGQQGAVATARELERSAQALHESYDDAAATLRFYEEELERTGNADEALQKKWHEQSQLVSRLSTEYHTARDALAAARQEVAAVGVETEDLAAAEQQIAAAARDTQTALEGKIDALREIKTISAGAAEEAAAAERAAAEEADRAARATQAQADAWHRLGVATKAELAQLAEGARSDFSAIEASGEASYEQLEHAARTALEKIAAAHGGIVPEADRARHAIFEQLETQREAAEAAERGARAAQEQAAAWHRLGVATASELQQAAEQARSDFSAIEASGEASYEQLEHAARTALERIAAAHGGIVPEADRARHAIFEQLETQREAAEAAERGARAAQEQAAAWHRLGVTTASELQQAAEQARSDFSAIEASGEASYEQLEHAARTALERIAAAHGGIVPEADRARLAVYQQVEAVDHVGDAFRRMGIQSRDELERTVDEARRDFYTIRDSGVASYSQIQAAARQYAATLRAANNGVLPPAEQARLAIWRIGEAAEEAGRKGQEGLGHVRAGAADLGAAVQTIASAFVLQEIVDANKHAEAWAKSMEQVVGSSEAAAAEIAYVRSEANRLGLDVRAAADSYTLLAASAKGTALTGADVRKVWSAVSESMARLGKSSADTEGALLALGQMASKGTVQAEELRGQLGERLPGAMQTAAKAMGVTTAQLGKMMEQGELAASDFLPRFADALEESFGRGEAAIDTFAAKQARLMNGFRELSLLASETGLFDGAAGGLEAIGDLVKHVAVGTKTATAYMGELGSEIGLAVARFTERDFAGFTDDILAARAEMDKSIAEYADRVYGVVPAAHAAGDAVVATATEARTAYSELSKELQKVVDGIDKAGDATKAFGKLDLGNIDGVAAVEELNNLITAMGEKAELSGEQIEKELGAALDKLSGEQLQSLQFEAEAAFGEIEGGAENLELILRASLGASLKQLGVDAKELETGMDAATRVAVDGFRAVADNAQASGEAVRRSFDNALGQVTNVRGVEELGKALRSAFEEGKLSASEYEARVALLERRHQALAATVDRDLAAAFQRMGIKSRAELKAVADQAEADYQRIKASGQASADGLAQAAERWKTAAEAAGDRAAAAQAKVSEELHRSAASAESMEGRTTAALHQVAEAAEDTGDALSRIQDALQSATTISEIQAVEEELRRLRTEGKLTAEELASGMEAVDQRAAAVSNTMASIALGTDAMFRNLSTSLANAYYEVEGVDGELAQLAERARLAADSFYIPDSSISSWAELMRHQRSLITQFAEQAEGAAQLQAQLQGVEGANERLVVQARRTVQTFDLLDQTQLDGITREIERVAAASDRLKDSITSTVSRLQDELDRLEGDQAAIERRNYEQEKRALQQQLDEAQRGLNRDVAQEAEKALGLLERVHAARKAEIDTQADPAPTPATARTVTPPPTTPPAAQPTQATSGGLRTIRLEAGGFDVDVLTDGDIEAFGHRLVQVIEQAGLRVV